MVELVDTTDSITGRHIGNDMLVRCKFGERLTGNADVNAERNLKKRDV
jgi:hypothetical protein